MMGHFPLLRGYDSHPAAERASGASYFRGRKPAAAKWRWLSMLLEGIDRRGPQRTWDPQLVSLRTQLLGEAFLVKS
jgi:hypothetical protein